MFETNPSMFIHRSCECTNGNVQCNQQSNFDRHLDSNRIITEHFLSIIQNDRVSYEVSPAASSVCMNDCRSTTISYLKLGKDLIINFSTCKLFRSLPT